MNPPNFSHIDRLYEQYLAAVREYVELYFEDEFKPFLDRNGLSFVRRQGLEFMYDSKTGTPANLTKDCEELVDLWISVPGMGDTLFIELMPDYRPETEVEP